mgnify:CR=1 FL=1
MTAAVPRGPLVGVRVLDLGTRIGAPFAATLLGDLGAEIIKVELPGVGDFMRTIGPFVDDYSLFWAVEGRSKKSIPFLKADVIETWCPRCLISVTTILSPLDYTTLLYRLQRPCLG